MEIPQKFKKLYDQIKKEKKATLDDLEVLKKLAQRIHN